MNKIKIKISVLLASSHSLCLYPILRTIIQPTSITYRLHYYVLYNPLPAGILIIIVIMDGKLFGK